MYVNSLILDFGIADDALEQHSILLEKLVQHSGDNSIHLSLPQDNLEVKQPRHISDPCSRLYSGKASFDIDFKDHGLMLIATWEVQDRVET